MAEEGEAGVSGIEGSIERTLTFPGHDQLPWERAPGHIPKPDLLSVLIDTMAKQGQERSVRAKRRREEKV